MSQLNISKTFSTLLMLSIVALTPFFNASANPTEVKLRFKYFSNGTYAVNADFDSATTSRCIARHRSSLYYEGDVLGDAGVIRRSTISRSLNIGRKSTSLRAFKLKGAAQKNGKDPIISSQVRLVCSGRPDLDSNIEARYIRCGVNAPRISLSQYLTDLRNKLAFSN